MSHERIKFELQITTPGIDWDNMQTIYYIDRLLHRSQKNN